MAHTHDADVRRSFGDKLDSMTGKRGEHPVDRASRIAGVKTTPAAQGDAAQEPVENWTKAPSRQVSDQGNVRK